MGNLFKNLVNDLKGIQLKNIIMLTIAGIVNAFGITMFLSPVSLYDTGMAGTSMFLAQLTPISLSVWLFILNVVLLLYGTKKQGFLFTFYAVYVVAIFSLGTSIITDVLCIDTTNGSPFAGQDLLLCALIGGFISGMTSGLSIRYGGVIDGKEVMAIVFAKKLGLSVGTFIMIYNATLYLVIGAVMNNWLLSLYSILTFIVGSKTLDFFVDGLDRGKCAVIITNKPKEVTTVLMETFETGATEIPAKGSYSQKEKTMVYFVVNQFQVPKLKELVKNVDSHAYIIISDISDAFAMNSIE